MELVNESPRVLGNRYEVGDLLGRGGMAEVHLGRDTRLSRTVAIKLLRPDLARDPIFQARFRREAQSAAALNHPAIVAVYDTGEETVTDLTGTLTTMPYIVMEYVEGRTLRDILDGRPLEPAQALDVSIGVLSALDYSHRSGIVHRDIKPGNVMVTPTGDVKVMDFGIARALTDTSTTMTQTQAVIGTAQYLSPEQARGETVDARSDLYSTGCLLFELLTGRPPFIADSPVAVAYQHVRESPRPPSAFNPAVPEAVDQIVLHSLAKERGSRYQSAGEFRSDIEAALSGRQVSALAAAAVNPEGTTEFLPAAGTRAMSPLPGGPYGQPPDGTTAAGLESDNPSRPPGAPERSNYGYDGRRNRRDQRGNRTSGYLLLVVGVIAVFGLVAFIVASMFSQGKNTSTTGLKVTVPTVKGLTLAEAQESLTKVGLSWKVLQAPDEQVEKGRISGVNPAQGTEVPKGTVVTLTQSTGSAQGTIPDVANKPLDEARAEITQAGFEVGNTQYKDDPDVKQGYVISTNPPINSSRPKGTVVNIIVASGNVHVPNMIGKTVDEAKSTLKGDLGLSVEIDYVSNDAEADEVVDQNIKDTSVSQGSTVRLTVSSGPTEQPDPTSSTLPVTPTYPTPTSLPTWPPTFSAPS